MHFLYIEWTHGNSAYQIISLQFLDVNEITYLVLKIYLKKKTNVGRFINVRNRLIGYDVC